MSPIKQRIAIAKACGLEIVSDGITPYLTPIGKNGLTECPNYLNDLNAIYKAEDMTLTDAQRYLYSDELYSLAIEYQNETNKWRYLSMTASQRSEALLKTLDLWEE